MSRFYEMEFAVPIAANDLTEDEIGLVKKTIEEEWGPDEFWDNADEVTTSGRGNLCGGESEHEFAARINRAVKKAVGRFVSMTIRATYLEDLPYEEFCLEEDEIGDDGPDDDGGS